MYFVISYDLRKVRNYKPLYDCFAQWKAVRLLESLWLAELVGPAATVRDILSKHVDSDDGLVVLELVPNFDWATKTALPDGAAWLKLEGP